MSNTWIKNLNSPKSFFFVFYLFIFFKLIHMEIIWKTPEGIVLIGMHKFQDCDII